jgi:hypothetical protein
MPSGESRDQTGALP